MSGQVDGIGHGDTYKFGIRTRQGNRIEKADPCAFFNEQHSRDGRESLDDRQLAHRLV